MKKFLLIMLLALGLGTTSYAAPRKEIVLSSDNTLSLSDSFNSASVTELMQKASKMDANLKSGYPIYLFMYTPGGSIQAGLELIEFLEGLNRPVHTITLFSASMGWQTVQHLGERYIMRYGVLMSHKARGTFSGEFGGNVSQLDSRYQLWRRRVILMDKVTVERSKGKQTLKSYTDSYTPELWLNGYEAVEQGYADAVALVKCDLSLNGTEERVLNFGFFRIRAVFSLCPLKARPLEVLASLMTNQGEMDLHDFLLKNGQFGPDCGNKTRSSYYSGPVDAPEEEEQPCAMDKTLTLEKILAESKKHKAWLNRNLRDHIEYSY